VLVHFEVEGVCTEWRLTQEISKRHLLADFLLVGSSVNGKATDLASQDLLGMQSSAFISLTEAARASMLQDLVGQRFLATVYSSPGTTSIQLCRLLQVKI